MQRVYYGMAQRVNIVSLFFVYRVGTMVSFDRLCRFFSDSSQACKARAYRFFFLGFVPLVFSAILAYYKLITAMILSPILTLFSIFTPLLFSVIVLLYGMITRLDKFTDNTKDSSILPDVVHKDREIKVSKGIEYVTERQIGEGLIFSRKRYVSEDMTKFYKIIVSLQTSSLYTLILGIIVLLSSMVLSFFFITPMEPPVDPPVIHSLALFLLSLVFYSVIFHFFAMLFLIALRLRRLITTRVPFVRQSITRSIENS